MKVVIIEDEINAYQYLQSILRKVDRNIEVVAHHDSIKSSVNFFQKEADFDLVFMDIQIADGLSFEIFNHIALTKPVIFTTAYDQYALDAFKVHSVDYLLKPIHIDDLKASLAKYNDIYATNTTHDTALITMIDQLQKRKKNRCLVKRGGHFEYVNVEDIAFVHSEDSVTFLFTRDNQRFIYAKTVEQLYEELDHDQFFQINRSQIVNASGVKQIHPFLNQRLKLVLGADMAKEKEFIVSRQKLTPFKEWMDR